MSMLIRLVKDQTGATAIEYGLLAGIIGSALLVGLQAVGVNIDAILRLLADTINAAQPTG